MASPQLENGYLKIANEIIDQFCRYRLSGEEWLVLWVIIRKTYGFNKKMDRIALSQFSEITGMKRPTVHRALKKLSSKKIIAVIKEGDRDIVSYGFRKSYKEWLPVIKKDNSYQKRLQPVIKKDILLSSKKITTKDTIQKTIKYNTLSGKPDLTEPILYLNQKAGKNFSPTNKSNTFLVKARFSEGRTMADFKKIIDRKCFQWLTDEKMIDYLRPKTLFNATNFENYLNEKEANLASRRIYRD